LLRQKTARNDLPKLFFNSLLDDYYRFRRFGQDIASAFPDNNIVFDPNAEFSG
jgi:hypothetical protein